MKNLIILFLFIVGVVSCKSTDKSFQNDIDESISSALGSEYEILDSDNYALCISEKDVASNWITFLVVDKIENKIIYGPEKRNAKVEWYSKSVIKIKELPGVIEDKKGTSTSIYYYDIIKKKKIDPSSQRIE